MEIYSNVSLHATLIENCTTHALQYTEKVPHIQVPGDVVVGAIGKASDKRSRNRRFDSHSGTAVQQP